MTRISTRWYRSLKARMMPACSASERLAMRLMPDAAGTICSPCGPVTIASSSEHSPLTTWPRWNRVCSPRITSTLAIPRSASTNITSRPCAAIDTAKFADTVVLPTPPLPPVTAMTLTGREALSSSSVSAWLLDSRVSRMGGSSTEIAGEVPLVDALRCILLELVRRAHQPHTPLVRRMQIFRHPLPIAQVGDPQLVAQRRGDHGAQARRFVHLGENAGGGRHLGKRSNDFLERVRLAVRRKRQQYACACGAELQRSELLREADISRTHPGGIDQDQFLGLEPLENLRQFLAAVRHVHGGAEHACIRHQLLACADAVPVGTHEREILAAMLHAPARRQFGDARRLAGTRGTYQRDDAAVDRAQFVDHLQLLEDERERN